MKKEDFVVISKYTSNGCFFQTYKVDEPAEVNVHWQLTESLLHSVASETSLMKVDAELSDLAFDHKQLVFVTLGCLINDTQHISQHQTV